MKNGNKIYHVCLGDDNHHYFGSITAIYDVFTPEQLGVARQRLWAYGITPEHPYKNKVCAIYCGMIYRTKTKRSNPLKQK